MRNSFDWKARSERLVRVGVERLAAARSLVKHRVFMRVMIMIMLLMMMMIMIMLSVDDDDNNNNIIIIIIICVKCFPQFFFSVH